MDTVYHISSKTPDNFRLTCTKSKFLEKLLHSFIHSFIIPWRLSLGVLQMTNLFWLCSSCSESQTKTPGGAHPSPVLATCLQHKGGGVPLSALPKDTTSELAGLFSTTSLICRAPSERLCITFLKSFGMTLQGD